MKAALLSLSLLAGCSARPAPGGVGQLCRDIAAQEPGSVAEGYAGFSEAAAYDAEPPAGAAANSYRGVRHVMGEDPDRLYVVGSSKAMIAAVDVAGSGACAYFTWFDSASDGTLVQVAAPEPAQE